MLSKSMRQYVKSQTKNEYTREVQNVYNSRLKNYAVAALKDLVLLSEKLPEDHQKDVFNVENMTPFFRSIFRVKSDEPRGVKDIEQRRRRVLGLCYQALDEVGSRENAWNLASDVMKILTQAGLNETFSVLVNLKGIYLKGFNELSESKEDKVDA